MSEKHVRSITLSARTLSIGDRFALKDIDGGTPTGDYVIDDIRIDGSYTISFATGNIVPFERVYVGCNGQYTRETNIVLIGEF